MENEKEENPPKKKWGGKREGSGRKPGRKWVNLTLTLADKYEKQALEDIAKLYKVTVSALVRDRFDLKNRGEELKRREEFAAKYKNLSDSDFSNLVVSDSSEEE